MSFASLSLPALRDALRSIGSGSVTLALDHAPGIALISLCNPRRHSSLSGKMMAELADAVDTLTRQSASLVGLVIAGSDDSKSFCAGLDLSAAKDHLLTPDAGIAFSRHMQDTLTRLSSLDILSVAAIKGACLGGGAELASACDFRCAEENSRIGFVQASMGVTPGWGGAQRVVELFGRHKALKLLTQGPLSATEALACGFVDAVGDKAMDVSLAYLQNSMVWGDKKVSPAAIKAMKELVVRQGGLEVEREVFGRFWGSEAHKKNPVFSLAAGAVAGSVESIVTYPTEYVKTRLQLQQSGKMYYKGPVDLLVGTVRHKGIFSLYRGLSAQIIGTAVKAGVRFLAYDSIADQLRDSSGKLTPGRSVLAGLGAGVIEAVIAVTPTETIKTKLIHDQNQPNPQYKGLIHGTRQIIKAEGLGGIYRGVVPVMLRQGANSAVRFSTYSTLKGWAQQYRSRQGAKDTDPLPSYMTFGIGAVAGIVTVYSTMPLDVVKTKMQSLRAKELYKGSLDCAIKVIRNDGVTALWHGATPRLARLIVSGGIVFTVYEEVMRVLDFAAGKT
ncbi:hypothetical protein BZG36_03576 [Bifiguratus adelaidae]|uniref:Uncharacterized protein n=1 Tax=Bifiguratus adelaidae TaxID=1938954 RepID=A0A261Y0A6_9FUNG|nr:hypothetical protein BZG36_03576 [Bifiguratus adelaidae]